MDIEVVTVYLSLGSNVGDRLKNLRAAMRRFCDEGIALLRTSSIYETEPVDNTHQGWFLNCVAAVRTTLEPVALLHALQRIEQQLGRERSVPKGPRTIDLDMLLYGDRVMRTDDLVLPHPRMLERRFVLVPLAEIAPRVRIPTAGKTAEETLRDLRDAAQARGQDRAQVRLFIKTLCA